MAPSKRLKKDEIGISENWKPTQKNSKSTTQPLTASNANESMVQYGGFASDNEGHEDDEVEDGRTAGRAQVKASRAKVC